MIKVLYKFFALSLIGIFLGTAFLCSCVNSAEDSLDTDNCQNETTAHSHQGKADHSSKKGCDCRVTKIINADITAKIFLTAPKNVSLQPFIASVYFSNKSIDLKFNLAYIHGPPGPISVVPLYIQFHSLRI